MYSEMAAKGEFGALASRPYDQDYGVPVRDPESRNRLWVRQNPLRGLGNIAEGAYEVKYTELYGILHSHVARTSEGGSDVE